MMPIGFATENHETILDVDHIIHHLQHRYSEVNFVRMPCVNDNQEFLHMAADWANEHIEDLLSEEGVSVNPQLAAMQAAHHHHHHH